MPRLHRQIRETWFDVLNAAADHWPDHSPFCREQICTAVTLILSFRKHDRNFSTRENWLRHHGEPIIRFCVDLVHNLPSPLLEKINRLVDVLVHEDRHSIVMLISELDQKQKAKGVYYTPPALAKYIISAALRSLKGQSKYSSSPPAVLEPSVGGGIFIREYLQQIIPSHFLDLNSKEVDWDFICRKAIPNIIAIDLSPAALVATQLAIAELLEEHHFRFNIDTKFNFFAGNTLNTKLSPIYSELKKHNNIQADRITPSLFWECCRTKYYDLVMGNPPFNALSEKSGSWIDNLLHGRGSDSENAAGKVSYFEVDESPLGEKKTWLHDDYVRFLRYAHWQIERNQAGCLAMVLNAGFIDNLTFRGVRYQLLKSFDQVEVINFGGDHRNARNQQDENLFGIETAIATLIASFDSGSHQSKSPAPVKLDSVTKPLSKIRYLRIDGGVKKKKAWCLNYSQNPDELPDHHPLGPLYAFDRKQSLSDQKFKDGWCVTDIFEKYWSAPVTARDHFVIDVSRSKLIERLRAFTDLRTSDETIRKTFFQTGRSKKYPAGDTRGWHLPTARRQLSEVDWESKITNCLYRPFDIRSIIWTPQMVDWPRAKFSTHMIVPDNPCLILRKQAPSTTEYNYVWVSQEIPIDGVIRSDNRGNEYCFPAFLHIENSNDTDNEQPKPSPSGADPSASMRRANLTLSFQQYVKNLWPNDHLHPENIFRLIYAVLHSQLYRQFFSGPLCRQFPRIFFPKSYRMAVALAKLGDQLIQTHTDLNFPEATCTDDWNSRAMDKKQGTVVQRINRNSNGYVNFPDGSTLFVAEEIWDFRIGTYQVCQKFLKDRIRSGLSAHLQQAFQFVIARIEATMKHMNAINSLMASSNGLASFDRCQIENRKGEGRPCLQD
ncbi:MAG: hypothetical protein P8M80_10060 [Pirellulaceae bacterium]|nr:hypothetical protein [Pirellulaceae bacterium]